MSANHPELLYHNLRAPLYPTNDPSQQLLAVRFAAPVRISSLRITPEGVASPTGPGQAYPTRWSGKVFLNVSPSVPVNAMMEMEIEVSESQHPLDFKIDMPPGVTTRMISLLTPAQTLSLSIYGFGPNPADPGPSRISAYQSRGPVEKEDWRWVTEWAAGVAGLLDLVGNDSTYSEVRERALSCLELAHSTFSSDVLHALLDHPPALARLFTSFPTSPLCRGLLGSKDHIMHLNLKTYIPSDHPLYHLAQASPTEKRSAAWRAIAQGRPALGILARTAGQGDDLLFVPQGESSSNLSRLLGFMERWAEGGDEESRKCLDLALDVISTAPQEPLVTRQLASRLPRLVLVSRIRGSSRNIGLSLVYANEIAAALLPCAAGVIEGKPAWPTILEVIQPYLDSLDTSAPLYRAYTGQSVPTVSTPFPDSTDGRALARLERALTSSTSHSAPNSLIHAVTPADLLSIIGPELLRTLAMAPIPPLDIPSSIPDFTPDSQASAWAGKVYSEHEFRTRENVGLGIAGMSGQGNRMSRPASRHVDEYAR